MILEMFIKRWSLLSLLLLLFLFATYEFSAVVRRNHGSNDLGVWYDDKSMYQIWLGLLWVYFEGPKLVTIESNGDSFFPLKYMFWSDCIGTSHHSNCNHECSKYIFNLIIITLHRNNPLDVKKFTQGWKCSKWSPFPW